LEQLGAKTPDFVLAPSRPFSSATDGLPLAELLDAVQLFVRRVVVESSTAHSGSKSARAARNHDDFDRIDFSVIVGEPTPAEAGIGGAGG
jgi:hypothetical protein